MKAQGKRIVVKVGTSTLTNEQGKSNLRRIEELALVLADLQNMGHEIVLVSSGAIAVGANKMHLRERPTTLRMKQAAAAVGQCENMFLYDKFFGYYDKTVAQILLIQDDIKDERRKDHLINTFNALLEQEVIPIVNENDSVSSAEIESSEKLFGDNDMLSAIVAVLTNADQLIILSDINGFYDKDPRLFRDAKLLTTIENISDDVYRLAGGAGSRRGTGGMQTKVQAADLATSNGIEVVIANGADPRILYDIESNQAKCTRFLPRA